jgi:hypothetical protein
MTTHPTRWWKRLAVCPPYDQDEDYQQAFDWLQNFKPLDTVQGYDKALEYAWRRFEQVSSASETLDKKADNIMRNAGLVAGLIGLAINIIKIDYPAALVPSLAAFMFSLILAALACNPTGASATASVQDVLEDVTNGHSSDAWMAASLTCAIAGRNAMNNWKADRIRWSTYAFCAGIVAFALPVSLMWLF